MVSANKITKLLYKTFETICLYPELEKSKPEIVHHGVRIFIIKKKYLIAYKKVEDKIRILRVLSTYQDVCLWL